MYKCMYVFFPWMKTSLTLCSYVLQVICDHVGSACSEQWTVTTLESPVVEGKWQNILRKYMPSITYIMCLRGGIEVGYLQCLHAEIVERIV